MTQTAVVFISGLAGDPSVRVAGLSLLERALLSAARAGVRRCFVTGGTPPARDSRHPAEVNCLPQEAAAAVGVLRAAGLGDGDTIMAMHAAAVLLPRTLGRLADAGAGPAGAAVLDAALPVAALPLRLLQRAWASLASGESPGLDGIDGVQVVSTSAGDFAARARSAADIPAIERGLLLGLENPRDGRVDRLLNRKLSRPLSRLFLHTRLTPNSITLLSFMVALLGALGFAQGTYWPSVAGALLLQFAAVLDCCDGEVARVKFMESKFGDALDITLDSIANAAIFAGIARGALVTGQLAAGQFLGIAAAFGIMGSFAVVTYVERWLPEPAPTPQHRLAQRLVAAMTSRDFSVIVLAAGVTGTLPWFLWGSAIGANVFWLLLLALVMRGRTPGVTP